MVTLKIKTDIQMKNSNQVSAKLLQLRGHSSHTPQNRTTSPWDPSGGGGEVTLKIKNSIQMRHVYQISAFWINYFKIYGFYLDSGRILDTHNLASMGFI